ncbi:MAG: hypothetical protein IPM54_16775 [Polyangiaceae bacterium]|nr:hypothetical protein [Polyangiaceae bacterium]
MAKRYCRFEERAVAPASLDAFRRIVSSVAEGVVTVDKLADDVDRLLRDRPLDALLRAEVEALAADPSREVRRVEGGQVILFEDERVRAHLRRREPTARTIPRFSDTATHLLLPVRPVRWSITTYRTTTPLAMDRFRQGVPLDAPPTRRESPTWHGCAVSDRELSATVVELDGPAWFLEVWQRPGLLYAWRFDDAGRSVALVHAQHRVSRLALVLDLLRNTRRPEAEAGFRALLGVPYFDLRWKALQGLAALGVPDLEELLAATAEDTHPEVNAAARAALEKRRAGR